MSWKASLGVALTAAAICLAGGGVYGLHILKQKKLDPETLCSLEGPKAVTLVLIDKTDPLTAADQVRLRGLVTGEANAVQRGGRMTVKLLQQKQGASETELFAAADYCNPGAEANPFFENPKRVAARYRNAFREPVERALASAGDQGSAPFSPIAGAIGESISLADAEKSPALKLILVSDLMEHTKEASAYSGALRETALRKAMPEASQARLKGADVHVLILARPQYAKQQAAAIETWRRFFKALTEREPEFMR